MIRKPPTKRRFGYVLFEVVLVIAFLGIIGTITLRLFHGMIRHQQATTTELAMVSAESRLQVQFQRDVNKAVDAELAQERLTLETPSGESVIWTDEDNSIVRTLRDQDTTRNDHFYDLATNREVKFERIAMPEGRGLIVISLVPNGLHSDERSVTSNRSVRVAAELSRNHRWVSNDGGTDE